MSPVTQKRVEQITTVVVTTLATAVVQWALYTLTLKEDVRELQRGFARLDCQVQVLAASMTLPQGCIPRVTADPRR